MYRIVALRRPGGCVPIKSAFIISYIHVPVFSVIYIRASYFSAYIAPFSSSLVRFVLPSFMFSSFV